MPKSLQELYGELQMASSSETGRLMARSAEDQFIVKLAQLLLACGVQARATDVHLEPTDSGMRVRYRIDGILHEMLKLPKEICDPLVRSIKIKANMATDIVGRSKPQDGRMDFLADGARLDLRVSSFPTLFGDVLALRILDRLVPVREFEQLGFPPEQHKAFESLIHRPNGLVLVTGPANSGKTTTLYSALSKLRSTHVKIFTLEDPVEYQMEGVNQGQINPGIGLTFAAGLRAALRQDANIILVGEIRDTETADIAVRAALTGHLVFSTLHTRHASGALSRLLDMQIEPHLIAASLTGVLAQRLVRLLCPDCKVPDSLAANTAVRLWTQETTAPPPDWIGVRFYKSVGCPSCNQTGYTGRTGIFELLVLTEELRQVIFERAPSRLYRMLASKMRTMLIDGLEKAAQGLTTIEEVLRVSGDVEET